MNVGELIHELRIHRTNMEVRARVTDVIHQLERFSLGTPVDESLTVDLILGSDYEFKLSMVATADEQGLVTFERG